MSPHPLFCISWHLGAQAIKYRLVDDAAKSRVKSADSANGAYRPRDLNMFIAIAETQRNPTIANKMRTVDFPHAYKTIETDRLS